MLKIIIYKDRIAITKWEETSKSWAEHDVSKLDGHITQYFNMITEIKEEVTIGEFMLHLERHEVLIDYCFAGYLNNIPLRLFLDEINKEGEPTDLEEIELVWEGEVINKDLALIGYLRGWFTEDKIKEIGEENDLPIDVSFTPLRDLKNCRFVINENAIINDFGEIGNIDQQVIFEGFYRWTFFEVISNFLCEISLGGTPEEARKLSEEIKNRKFNKEEVALDNEKAEFWLSFLEVELEEMKLNKEIIIELERYEEVSKITKDIEIIEKELEDLKDEIKKNNSEI